MKKVIPMVVDKPCKHSVRFGTDDPDAAIASVYVKRSSLPNQGAGVNSITVTVEMGDSE